MGGLTIDGGFVWRRAALLVSIVITCCGLLAGCTEGDKGAGSKVSPSSSKEPVTETPDQEGKEPSDSVSVAPKLPGGQVLASTESRHGNAALAIKDSLEKGSLAIMVKCEGKGQLIVSLKPAGVRFPLECIKGEVNTTYNQIDLKRGRESASIEVAAPSSVGWALTAGQ